MSLASSSKAAPHKAAYSPDVAPSDYLLFPNLKGRKFSNFEEATLAADGLFAAQPK
jgi:hypothetical protein